MGNPYKYNDQGVRTQIGANHKFVLDGDKVIVETIGSTTIHYTYDVDGSLLSMNYNGNEYFYVTNMQGDVIELIDINGNSVAKYKYDAWGNVIYQTGSMADENPYRYRGYRYDEETGLYYLQSRYYNPEIGRFISADDLYYLNNSSAISMNLYSYCENNPINFYDPTGYSLMEIFQELVYQAQVAFGNYSYAYGGAGAVAMIDSPVPGPADVVALAIAGVVTVVIAGVIVYETVDAISSISVPTNLSVESDVDIGSSYISQSKERSDNKIARRINHKSRKAAREAAKRAGKGAKPIHHPNGHAANPKPHYHPDVPMPKTPTPKSPNPHDHHNYPKGK